MSLKPWERPSSAIDTHLMDLQMRRLEREVLRMKIEMNYMEDRHQTLNDQLGYSNADLHRETGLKDVFKAELKRLRLDYYELEEQNRRLRNTNRYLRLRNDYYENKYNNAADMSGRKSWRY